MADSGGYAALLWALLFLFFLRVVGQVVVAVGHPSWLPPMREWYSGLIPYPVLLPVQIAFLYFMTRMALDVSRASGFFAGGRPGTGRALVAFALVYALGMVVRYRRWRRTAPERRRAWIPIPFHLVLAAFLAVLGGWYLR